MKLKSVNVVGLLDRGGEINFEFNDDLNILTGRNGAGKTSLLKLIWYVISGNIFLALKEVPFQVATIVTDVYECTVYRTGKLFCKVEFCLHGGERYLFEDVELDGDAPGLSAEEQANQVIIEHGSSVFFPTFRRIEGGFSLSTSRVRPNSLGNLGASKLRSDIEDALETLSKRLTNNKHTFVSAISTADIVGILLTRYANLSTEYNDIQQAASDEIIATIKQYKSEGAENKELSEAHAILDQIRTNIEFMEKQREEIMAPIEAVRGLVEKLFKHIGIKIGTRLSFGDAANAVNSDSLSAGEKQMLSFICYNAFNDGGAIFIDEPELSLHVDWQRQLFPILLNQQSSNQFIIATHSPFIYSKFPDKEISIDLDRGDSGN